MRDNYTEAAQEESKLSILFRKWVQAKDEYDDSCRSLSQARAAHEVCGKKLAELSEQVDGAVRNALVDPTAPKSPYVEIPTEQLQGKVPLIRR